MPNYKYGSLSFGINLIRKNKEGIKTTAVIPALTPELFFVDMVAYDKNYIWANKMVDAAYSASEKMKDNWDIDAIINDICRNVRGANRDECYGVPRVLGGCFTIHNFTRGLEYLDKYIEKLGARENIHTSFSPKSNNEYKDACV